MLFRASNTSDLEAKKKNSATVTKLSKVDLVDHFRSQFDNSFVNPGFGQNSINPLLTLFWAFVNRYFSLSKFFVVRDPSV